MHAVQKAAAVLFDQSKRQDSGRGEAISRRSDSGCALAQTCGALLCLIGRRAQVEGVDSGTSSSDDLRVKSLIGAGAILQEYAGTRAAFQGRD